MNTEKKNLKSLTRDEIKNILGGKQQSLCIVGGAWILFDGNAAQAAIACGQTYGSACYSCGIS